MSSLKSASHCANSKGSRQTSRGEATLSNLPRTASFSRSQLDWAGHDGSPGRARSKILDDAAFAGSAHPINEGRAHNNGVVPAPRKSCLLFTVYTPNIGLCDDRRLRIAVVHGVRHERPLSRQRCASTPIGFDPIIQSLGASRQLGPVRGRALICFRLDNRLPLEHGKAHVTARNQKRLARKSSCALVRPHNDDAQLGNARGVRAGARVRFGII
jgi:hypothetical protein